MARDESDDTQQKRGRNSRRNARLEVDSTEKIWLKLRPPPGFDIGTPSVAALATEGR